MFDRSSTLTVLLAVALAGCATSGRQTPSVASPEAVAAAGARPGAAEEKGSLAPSPAALRVAERVVLTGRETGTMWTFENPPLDLWERTYGFRPDSQWLEHVRLSSVRYGEICSASFVSPDGLAMTNHHCARECAEALSDAARDYVRDGFYARQRQDELLCPDLFLDQLVGITDVTAEVRAAVPVEADDRAKVAARDAALEAIRARCEAESGHTCQVVSLYRGGQYQLYEYRRYAPVKLVFVPELQAGYFGGDPDNFTYPRYALDVAFVRAYEPDSITPAPTPHHFEWDPHGAEEGELVFLTGNPGGTSRLITVSQLLYERSYRHPLIIAILQGQRDLLRTLAARGPEIARAVRDDLFGLENSLKSYTGQMAGLRDSLLVGRKIRWEREFRHRVNEDPELRVAFGDIWERMDRIQEEKLRLSPRVNLYNPAFLGGPYETMAAALAGWLTWMKLPEEQRPESYRGEAAAEREALLRRSDRPDPEVAARLLALRLELARRFLLPDDPFLGHAFQPGETPREAAERLIRTTRVMDATHRRRLMDAGDRAAIDADPLLRLGSYMERAYRELEPRWEELSAAESVQEKRLADALFAVFGTTIPPDATFTLRISDGVVRRYPYNGTFAPPVTTFYGLYARAAEFHGEEPWKLADSFAARRDSLRLSTPLNFVTTNDISGGNSGSPMIDREARVVGVAFDGNMEQLPNEFVFTTEAGRSIGVHAAGILEALSRVYDATELVDELLGGARSSSPSSAGPTNGRERTAAGRGP